MFSTEHADFVEGFVSCLRHPDGEWAGKPFRLIDWQRKAVRMFYGTVRDDGTGRRKYQYLYLEIPKKNGKSELAAALGLYHLIADGEVQGEVYICAADRENAGIIFTAALGMLRQSKTLTKQCRIRESVKEIIHLPTGTKMKVMSAEAYSKHGYKPSCVIFDELHAQPNRELWDIMTFGAGAARRQPVWIVLTTAGDDPDHTSIGWEVHQQARKIIDYRAGKTEGNFDNPVWLPFIFGLPDDSEVVKEIDIYDEKVWYECNPSLGQTIDIETVRTEALDAKNNPARERLFRWLRLNQWIAVKAVGWLPLTLFDATERTELPELTGYKCFGGLDLSTTTDLTAFVLLFPPQKALTQWVVKFQGAWLPDEDIAGREKQDHVPYIDWNENGYIDLCPGDTIDYMQIRQAINDAADAYELQMLGVDPYMSRSLTQYLDSDGINIVEIPQNLRYMSPAMKELEKCLRDGAMVHLPDPAARWCFGNVRIYVDGNENIKPMKNRSIGRIDIMVAWIIAVAAASLNSGGDLNAAIEEGEWTM